MFYHRGCGPRPSLSSARTHSRVVRFLFVSCWTETQSVLHATELETSREGMAVYRAGTEVEVFYRMERDGEGYFPVTTYAARCLKPRFGMTDGWMTARVLEDWPPHPTPESSPLDLLRPMEDPLAPLASALGRILLFVSCTLTSYGLIAMAKRSIRNASATWS